jgi:hypothetical protein
MRDHTHIVVNDRGYTLLRVRASGAITLAPPWAG